MKNNLLLIDIGNTTITVGHFFGNKPVKLLRIPSGQYKNLALSSIKRNFPVRKIEAAVIAGVVPKISRFLKERLSRKLGLHTLVVGQDLRAPIVNKYKNPDQVGVDRLMNALAAFRKYRKETIVIDFGTAITFDVVSKKGEYLGGVIAPGIEISLEALFQRTALLPKIRLSHPKSVLGADTVESIRAGCSFGIGGLCDRIVEEIKRDQRFDPIVIATGGYAEFMSRYCESIRSIDPVLTLRGILLSWQAAKKIP